MATNGASPPNQNTKPQIGSRQSRNDRLIVSLSNITTPTHYI